MLTIEGPDGYVRSVDEHFDTMMGVREDPTGAMMAIQSQAREIDRLTLALSTARNDALNEAIEASKEPIATIVHDGWFKNDWPVTSHGHQKVQEAVQTAILALKGE